MEDTVTLSMKPRRSQVKWAFHDVRLGPETWMEDGAGGRDANGRDLRSVEKEIEGKNEGVWGFFLLGD